MQKKILNKKKPLPQKYIKYNKSTLWLIALGIIFFTGFIFLSSLKHEFLTWDDKMLVNDNKDIRGIGFENLKTMFSSYYIGMYQPLTTYTYALLYHFFGLNSSAFHGFNIIIHMINTGLVFYLIFLISKRIEPSAFVAFFFGIHPMHVESVVWVAELKDLMYGMFFIASLCCYVIWLKNKITLTGTKANNTSPLYYIIAILLFILSCLSKSAAVVLPVILLVIDYFFERIQFSNLLSKKNINIIIEKIPFFLIALFFGIKSIQTQSGENAIVDITPLFTAFDRFFLVCYSTSFYIIRLILPIKLSTLHYYPLNHDEPFPPEYYIAPLFIIAIILLIVLLKKYRKLLAFGFMFFLFSIILVLQIIPVGQAIVSERYTYIPYIGLLFIPAIMIKDLIDKNKSSKSIILSIVLVIGIAFSIITFQRIKVWKDTITLFTDVIEKDPDVFYSYTVRGGAYLDKKQYQQGIADYEKAIKLQPNYYDPYFNLGKAYYYLGDYERSLQNYTKAIELKPDFAEAYSNRAAVFFIVNMLDKTIEDCNKAISLKPDYADAYVNRGNAKGMKKDYEGSITDFSKALSINPFLYEAHLNRGVSYISLGKTSEACNDFQSAFNLGDKTAINLINKHCK